MTNSHLGTQDFNEYDEYDNNASVKYIQKSAGVLIVIMHLSIVTFVIFSIFDDVIPFYYSKKFFPSWAIVIFLLKISKI